MNRRQRLSRFGLFLGVVLFSAAAYAELADVHLKDGTVIRGDVARTDDSVIVRNADGERTIPNDQVERVEPVQKEVDVDDEYRRRFDALDANDVVKHYDLALWLREQQRWDLVAEQCYYVLKLDPQHANAKTLAQMAERKLEQEARRDDRDGKGTPSRDKLNPGRVSKADVNRLRFYEFGPYSSAVSDPRMRFVEVTRKRDFEERIAEALRAIDEQNGDSNLQDAYARASNSEQLRLIVENTGLRFADNIEILGDTGPMSVFRREVLPIVRRSCGRSGCHASSGVAHEFRLPRGSIASDASVYTAFLVLDRLATKQGPLLDRGAPSHSVLLNYLVPADTVDHPHPLDEKGRPIRAALKGRDDPRYEVILNWIRSLSFPHPEYKLDYDQAPSDENAGDRKQQDEGKAPEPKENEQAPTSES